MKRISKQCADGSFQTAVEEAAARQGEHNCFDKCGLAHRNTSSPCWIRCFEETVLGNESSRPGGELGGMSKEALLDAWAQPFASSDVSKGGCPALPIH